MKRDFTHENFEDFLKRSADSLRMKAPDKVWQNLSKELNKRRRRFIVGVSAFLLISSAVGYAVISNMSQPDLAIQQQPVQQQNTENLTREKANASKSNTTVQRSFTPIESPHIAETQEQSLSNKPRTIITSLEGGLTTIDEQTRTPLAAEEQVVQNDFTPTVVDSYTEFDQKETIPQKEGKPLISADKNASPLTIESVINSFKTKNKKSKVEKQFYFTPTISYRKLSENKSYLRSLDPSIIPANYPALHSSVNNNVTHKPDIGFELGYTTKYALSKKLKLRTGLQFNVNRYDVKAFSAPISIATFALDNGASVGSIRTYSDYSNDPLRGYETNWLQNLSFQLSAPVGVEYNISSNDKMEFGIATTVQPTYVLGDRAYLITTDYKSYAQVPGLIRHWNVNTAMETFVIVKSGKTQWQVGPQVRYQLLSSFISKYPVKENLFDFGLKVGVTLNK